jgi:hypothetical protein
VFGLFRTLMKRFPSRAALSSRTPVVSETVAVVVFTLSGTEEVAAEA